MPTSKRKPRRHQPEHDTFYETMPLTGGVYYGNYDDRAIETPPPDADFDRIDDTGRDVAIQTLVFVALATIAVCLLLIWGVQIAQETLPVIDTPRP